MRYPHHPSRWRARGLQLCCPVLLKRSVLKGYFHFCPVLCIWMSCTVTNQVIWFSIMSSDIIGQLLISYDERWTVNLRDSSLDSVLCPKLSQSLKCLKILHILHDNHFVVVPQAYIEWMENLNVDDTSGWLRVARCANVWSCWLLPPLKRQPEVRTNLQANSIWVPAMTNGLSVLQVAKRDLGATIHWRLLVIWQPLVKDGLQVQEYQMFFHEVADVCHRQILLYQHPETHSKMLSKPRLCYLLAASLGCPLSAIHQFDCQQLPIADVISYLTSHMRSNPRQPR